MDEFLKPNASLRRLIREYFEYGSLTIGFDFDGTVYDYHKKGETYTLVVLLLNDLKEIGCKLICWTACENHQNAITYMQENGIPCDGINCDGVKLGWESRKPFFSALLDDRAGLKQVYNELSALVKIVNLANEKVITSS